MNRRIVSLGVFVCAACLASCGGGTSLPGSAPAPKQRLVGEVFATAGEIPTAEIVSNAGYAGNLPMSRAIRDAGKQNLLDMLFMFRPALVAGQEHPIKLFAPDSAQRLRDYVSTNADLLMPGIRVLILDEIYWNPPNQSDDPALLQLQLDALKTAVAVVRNVLPNAAIGITVTPYATFGRPNTVDYIKRAVALVDWVGTDPYWLGDPSNVQALHDWSRTFHGVAKAANGSVETWFIAQAFKLPSSDLATFNRFIAEELVHAEQYDNILFFGWQFASELDVSSIGANFPPETKRLYLKFFKK